MQLYQGSRNQRQLLFDNNPDGQLNLLTGFEKNTFKKPAYLGRAAYSLFLYFDPFDRLAAYSIFYILIL